MQSDRIKSWPAEERPHGKRVPVGKLTPDAFAAAWPDPAIVEQLVSQLPWLQNIALLERPEHADTRLWYVRQAIGAISHDGVLDPVTGRVKFGPFFDHEFRVLTYWAEPPPDAQGEQHWQGAASADGTAVAVTGDDVIIPAPLIHPADCRPEDFSLSMTEITAYGAAWKIGEAWPIAPHAIPMDYVTRAATLWRGGEAYLFSPLSGPPPFCWIPAIQPSGDAGELAASAPAAVQGGGALTAPSTFLPGESLPVTIQVTPEAGTAAYAVEVRCPAGCWILNADGAGTTVVNGRQVVRYGPFLDDQPRTWELLLNAPQDAPEQLTVGGALSMDGRSVEVQSTTAHRLGEYRVTVEAGPPRPLLLHARESPGTRYLIEVSSDFLTWTRLGNADTTSAIEIQDPEGAESAIRIYRLRAETE